MFFIGFYILAALCVAIESFGGTVTRVTSADSSGYNALLLAFVIFGIAIYLLWKFAKIDPFRIMSTLAAFGVLGISGLILSSYIPSLVIPSFVLIGAGSMSVAAVICCSITLMKLYPSRFIVPIQFAVAMLSLLIFSRLVAIGNIQLFYTISLFIFVAVAILYILVAPYMRYALRNESQSQSETSETVSVQVSVKTEEGLSKYAFDKLAGQELRLAELIMQGYSHPEIIKILKVTDNTVRGYRKMLYSKLQIHSRRELFELVEKHTNLKNLS
jgi:DNA-binding CsgD family transcriptional regulator